MDHWTITRSLTLNKINFSWEFMDFPDFLEFSEPISERPCLLLPTHLRRWECYTHKRMSHKSRCVIAYVVDVVATAVVVRRVPTHAPSFVVHVVLKTIRKFHLLNWISKPEFS